MDFALAAAALAAILLLVLGAVVAGELAARLFLEASETPRERRR